LKVIWTDAAANDLEEIHNYIQRDSPDSAQRVAKLIYDRIMRLTSPLYRGRPREEDSAFEFVMPSLPYIILYEIVGEGIIVIAIRHTSRDRT
jgi:plasmid stabilization system protein ParE